MKIKKLSSDLIAVFLSDQDIIEYDIDINGKIPPSDELHKFLFEIMEAVRKETGFDPYHGGQVVVEASPTDTGLNLLISKVKPKSKVKKMTQEQFSRVRKITVAGKKAKNSEITPADYLKRIMSELGLDENEDEKKSEKNRVFIFTSFDEWEKALCRMDSDLIAECSLYRSEAGYALITNLDKENIYYNILSEFALLECRKEVTLLTIKENWTFIAEGNALSGMCEAVKAMQ